MSRVICIKEKKNQENTLGSFDDFIVLRVDKTKHKTNIFQRFILSQFYVGIRKCRLLLICNTLQVINRRYISDFTQLKNIYDVCA